MTALEGQLAGGSGRRSGAPVVAGVAGMAGVGKTALAVHVAHRVAGSRPDGQLYVDLLGAQTVPLRPADVLSHFLRALGVDGRAVPADPAERAALYRARLAGRRMLVVLDNAAGEEQVRPLLPGAGTCSVLITSRRRLGGLEGVRWVSLDELPPAEGVQLLARILDDERVRGRPGDAAEIVRLCGGLPLAVRIAGARLAVRPSWPLDRLAAMLGDQRRRLDRLTIGDLEVRASLALSQHGLDGTARRLLRGLGLFDVPDFTDALAPAVLGGPPDEAAESLEALLDAQLVAVAGTDVAGQVRYRLHDLVRLLAREQAESEDGPADRAGVLERGLGLWLALAERMAARVPGPCYAPIGGAAPRTPVPPAYGTGRPDPLLWFDAERATLLSAVHQACELGLDELAFDLAGRLEKYFDLRGMYAEWVATNTEVSALCRRTGNLRGEAVMLRGLIDVRMWIGQGRAAGSAADSHGDAVRLLEMFTRLGEDRGRSDAAVMCSWALTEQGRPVEAIESATRALHWAQAAGHPGGRARAHVALAVALRDQQRTDLSIGHLTSALADARELGNARYEATVLQFLGIASIETGDLGTGERRLYESLAISRRYADDFTEALTMLGLARLHAHTADPRASAEAEAALAIGREHGMTYHVADSLAVLGGIALAAGRSADAVACLEESVALWRTRGWLSYLAAALTALGRARAGDDLPAARAAWSEARELYDRLQQPVRAAELDGLLAPVAL